MKGYDALKSSDQVKQAVTPAAKPTGRSHPLPNPQDVAKDDEPFLLSLYSASTFNSSHYVTHHDITIKVERAMKTFSIPSLEICRIEVEEWQVCHQPV